MANGYSGNGFTVHATADFSFNGERYHAKHFENSRINAVEVYGFYGPGEDCAGMEKWIGYAHDLELLGRLAKLALGMFTVELCRSHLDDGVNAMISTNFEASIARDDSSGFLRAWVIERDSGRIICDGEGGYDLDSLRSYLGELEIARLDRAVRMLPAA